MVTEADIKQLRAELSVDDVRNWVEKYDAMIRVFPNGDYLQSTIDHSQRYHTLLNEIDRLEIKHGLLEVGQEAWVPYTEHYPNSVHFQPIQRLIVCKKIFANFVRYEVCLTDCITSESIIYAEKDVFLSQADCQAFCDKLNGIPLEESK